jgi:predicted  nucleic acid-binding Zn-ribbon protein
MATLREASKQKWTSKNTIEHINAGSLQRIADATEAMAKNYTAMQTDLDWYKRQYTERGERIAYLRRSRASLQGQITKLRKQLADREASAT